MNEIEYYLINLYKTAYKNAKKICELANNLKSEDVNGHKKNSNMLLDSYYIIMAVSDEKVIGYASLLKDCFASNDLVVNIIAVDLEHQHQHIGSDMLNIALDIANKQERTMEALIGQYNIKSQNLFEKYGFIGKTADKAGYITYYNDQPVPASEIPYETDITFLLKIAPEHIDIVKTRGQVIDERLTELFEIINYTQKTDDNRQMIEDATKEWKALTEEKMYLDNKKK